MELRCENCGAPLGAPKAFGGKVVCPFCKTEQAALVPGAVGQRARTPLPEKFQVHEDGNGFELSWRWFGIQHVIVGVVALIWLGIVGTFLSVVWKAPGAGQLVFAVRLIPMFHALMGLGMVYFVLAGILNSTRVTLRNETIAVRHGPMPWFGRRNVPARKIVQLYVREQVSYRSQGAPIHTWEVNAIDENEQQIRLLNGLRDPAQALWLEEELERRLHIVDAPVEGEYAKRRA